MKILVVDDHAVVRSMLSGLLAGQADVDTVTEAESGQAALQLLNDGLQIDIMVTDIQMPGMDGFELTRRVALLWPGIAVVVLTSLPKATTCEKALAAGAKECLSKDDEVDELFATIQQVYTKHQPPRLP